MADTSTSEKVVADALGGRNVIAVSFEDDDKAYTALTSLKELDSQRRVSVIEAVVVIRGEDGQVAVKDRVEPDAMPATAGGGLLGLLVGILGGPLGVLIGGSYGLFVGSLVDLYDVGEADSALAEISSSVKLGRTALLAEVEEQSPEVLDTAMAAAGGTVMRRSAAEIEAEIAAAEDAERKAKWEARKELIRGRHEHDKAAIDAKMNELKDRMREQRAFEDASGATLGGAG